MERDTSVATDDARTDAPAPSGFSIKTHRPSGGGSGGESAEGGWRGALAETEVEAEAGADAGDDEVALPAEIAEDGGDVAIPETADGYTLPKIEGHEWTKADEPALESFLAELHEAQAPQPVIDKALGWYAKHQAQMEEALEKRDAQDTAEAGKVLQKVFRQTNIKPTIAQVNRLLDDTQWFGEGFGDRLRTARTEDGRLLVNDPNLIRFLADVAHTVYRDGGGKDREAQIEHVMRSNFDEYKRRGLDRELTSILEKKNARQRPSLSASEASRLKAIEKIMATDFAGYRREHLDVEYAKLLQKTA